MMNRLDFNCFTGNWPFFRVRYNTTKKLSELHNRCGITGGFVSSCEAIFYQDPYDAERILSKELEGTPYMHAMVLNPTIPAWQDDLKRAVEELKIKAVRLMPGFHNYSLTDPVLDQVCDSLRTYGLPLIITLRILDDRTSWMFHPQTVPVEDLIAFLDRNSDIVTLLTCTRKPELTKLAEQFKSRKNLFTDVSGFKAGNFAVEAACESIGAEHIIYGSSAPLLELQATTIIVDRAILPEDTRSEIFSGIHFFNLLNR